MKITDVTFRSFDLGEYEHPYWNSIITSRRRSMGFTVVDTDEGVSGVTFGSLKGGSFGTSLAARVVGEDPLDAARLWHRMFTGWRKPVVKGDAVAAIGAVDNALWDLRGKILGQPVYRLLGGFRDQVPVYAAGGYYEDGKGIPELVAEMESFVGAGYRRVKMKIGGASLAEDVARVRAVRTALGDGIDIMIDANNAWNVTEAIRFGRAVQDQHPYWFEEPCWPDDLEGMVQLRRAVSIPVATGEIEYTRWGQRDLVERQAADIIQADPQYCGGLTEWIRVAAIASAHHLPMAPHGNHYLGAHAVAAVDNGLIVESYAGLHPWQEDFLAPVELRDGELVLPQTPGLGIVVDWERLERAAR